MAKFRYIRISFWDDEKIIETLTPEQRYFYLFLMTNPDTTQLGIYKLNKFYTKTRLGWSDTVNIEVHLKALESKGFIIYDEETKEIGLLNWGKYNFTKSVKVIQCIRKEIGDVSSYKVIRAIQERCTIKEVKETLILKQRSLKQGGKDWKHKTLRKDYEDTTEGLRKDYEDTTEGLQPSELIENEDDMIGYREKEKKKKEEKKKEEEVSSSFFIQKSKDAIELKNYLLNKYGRKKIINMCPNGKSTVDELLDNFSEYWFDKKERSWNTSYAVKSGVESSFESWVNVEQINEKKPSFNFSDYEEKYNKISKKGIDEEEEKLLKKFINSKEMSLSDFEDYLMYWKKNNRLIISNIYSLTNKKYYNDYAA